ncbi:MAG: hypothetical protein A3I66_00005 [Burkholderiales bacterium RIFCSPLOWO2_02_FULL_57_36]|nr:MAG: hypothetical protein A3I66_00005 [Burkholderiales bacterium RIFCSPLOWO2_02_FULL_57_36]
MQQMHDVPWQKLVNPIDRMVGDVGEDMAQVGFWIEPVHARRPDERVHRGSALSAAVSTKKQEIFSAKTASPQRILGDIVVDLGHAIVTVIDQGLPLVEQ